MTATTPNRRDRTPRRARHHSGRHSGHHSGHGARRWSRRVALGALGALTLTSAVTIAPSVAAAESTSSSSVTGLSVGQSGPAVQQVQEALIAAGVPVAGGADGHFGHMTAAAVREFQSARGLEVTGTVDAATAAALGVAPAAPRVSTQGFLGLAEGNAGGTVKRLQEALVAAGVPLAGGADGYFGPVTTAAVKQFQTSHGITASGRIDEATVAAIAGAPAAPATPAPAAAPSTAGSSVVGLKVGARGPAVAIVQEALLNAGLRFSGGVDGIFGLATANAVTQFQHSKGLSPTGEIDAATAAALAVPTALPASSPAAVGGGAGGSRIVAGIGPGSIGNNVRAIQQALLDAGISFPGGADGIFGPATANAVKSFQSSRGLPATGRVDQATADALSTGAPAAPAPATGGGGNGGGGGGGQTGHAVFGERGERVTLLQQALLAAGIDVPGGADGIFGAQTAGAVMNLQKREGLPVTGVVDAATAAALGLAPAVAPPPPTADGIELAAFPMQGICYFGDTWHAPRGGGRKHEGVDIMGAEGLAVYAVVNGTISHVYHDRPGSLTGNGVRLQMPDGTYFFYAHLQGVADGIAVGTKVKAGQVIGYNGSTGNAGTPHLHFEVHPRGGAAVNPYPLVKKIDGCQKTALPG